MGWDGVSQPTSLVCGVHPKSETRIKSPRYSEWRVGKMNRRWSLEEKQRAVERMRSTRHRELAKELGIQKKQLYEWREQLRRGGKEPFAERQEQQVEGENRQLREALARKGLEGA